MNKKLFFSLMLAITTIGAVRACDIGPSYVFVANKKADVVIDGDLSDWANAKWIEVNNSNGVLDAGTRPLENNEDLSFKFALAYSDKGLLVAVSVLDDKIVADSAKPGQDSAPAWDDDACEFFIDGNFNQAENSRANNGEELKFGGEFSIVANGAYTSDFSGYPHTFGKLWQGAVKQVKQPTETEQGVVQYEYLITWEAMGQTSCPNAIGFNISLQDDDDGGRRDSALYLTGNPKVPFLDESKFGIICLKKD